MKIKTGELLEINRVINELSDTKLNTILAYKIARILKKIALEIAVIEENRTKILMPYIEKDKEGQPIINDNQTYNIIPETSAEMQKKLSEFFMTEIDVDIPVLKLEELDKIEVTPKQMEVILPIIEE